MQNSMRRLRIKKGITQADIAIGTGIHPSTLCRLERGVIRGNRSQWRKIARVLGVKLTEVFPSEENN